LIILEHWQIFHDDAQAIIFLNNLQEYMENQINWQGESREEVEVIELKDNKFLKCVLFEKIFNRHAMCNVMSLSE
jgi:hypothetical protein